MAMIMNGDQAESLRRLVKVRRERKRLPPVRVVAVTSGKGGVGKTSVVINLAYALTRLGKKVLIFDADLGLGNIDVMLGIAPKYNLHHVVKGKKRLKEIIVDTKYGFKVLPAASGVEEMAVLDTPSKMRLLYEVDEIDEPFDYMIVDTAAGISSNVTYFCIASQEILFVVSPEPTSITDAYALMKILYLDYGEKRFRMVVNSAKDQGEAKEVYIKLSTATDRFLGLSIDYLGYIPYDERVGESIVSQRILLEKYPFSPASKSLAKLAQVLDRRPLFEPKGNIQFFWRRLLGIDAEQYG